jgi:hypothetical protein
MSTTREVPFEALVLDGSNYVSWSIHVLNCIRTMGPHLRENKIECWQCNSQVFNYICSTLSDGVQEFIYEKIEIDAHTIWEILLEEYERENGVITSPLANTRSSSYYTMHPTKHEHHNPNYL